MGHVCLTGYSLSPSPSAVVFTTYFLQHAFVLTKRSNLDKMVAGSKTNPRITTDCDEHFLYIFNLSKATVSVSHFCRFRLFCLEAGRSEWCTDHLLTNLNCYEVHDFSSHYPVGFAPRATGLSTSTKSHTTLL